jgi:hypothetical protein
MHLAECPVCLQLVEELRQSQAELKTLTQFSFSPQQRQSLRSAVMCQLLNSDRDFNKKSAFSVSRLGWRPIMIAILLMLVVGLSWIGLKPLTPPIQQQKNNRQVLAEISAQNLKAPPNSISPAHSAVRSDNNKNRNPKRSIAVISPKKIDHKESQFNWAEHTFKWPSIQFASLEFDQAKTTKSKLPPLHNQLLIKLDSDDSKVVIYWTIDPSERTNQ